MISYMLFHGQWIDHTLVVVRHFSKFYLLYPHLMSRTQSTNNDLCRGFIETENIRVKERVACMTWVGESLQNSNPKPWITPASIPALATAVKESLQGVPSLICQAFINPSG